VFKIEGNPTGICGERKFTLREFNRSQSQSKNSQKAESSRKRQIAGPFARIRPEAVLFVVFVVTPAQVALVSLATGLLVSLLGGLVERIRCNLQRCLLELLFAARNAARTFAAAMQHVLLLGVREGVPGRLFLLTSFAGVSEREKPGLVLPEVVRKGSTSAQGGFRHVYLRVK